MSDIAHVDDEDLKTFGRFFEVAASSKLHKPCKQIQTAVMVCGLFNKSLSGLECDVE